MPRAQLIYPDQEDKDDDEKEFDEFGPLPPKGSGKKYNSPLTMSPNKGWAVVNAGKKYGTKIAKDTVARKDVGSALGNFIKSELKKEAKRLKRKLKKKAKQEFARRKKMLKKQLMAAPIRLLSAATKAIVNKISTSIVVPEKLILFTLKKMVTKGSIEYKAYWCLKYAVEKDYIYIVEWMKTQTTIPVMSGTTGRILSNAYRCGSTGVAITVMYWKQKLDPNFEKNKYKYFKELIIHGKTCFDEDRIVKAILDFNIDLTAYGPGNKEFGKMHVIQTREIDLIFPEKRKAGIMTTYARSNKHISVYNRLLHGVSKDDKNKDKNKITNPVLFKRVCTNAIMYLDTINEAFNIADDILKEQGADIIINMITSPEQTMYKYLSNLKKRKIT